MFPDIILYGQKLNLPIHLYRKISPNQKENNIHNIHEKEIRKRMKKIHQ